MPIHSRSNNRVLNPNARAVDVARAAMQSVVPIQQRKADAAFQVDGYAGVLYSYLDFGTPCACKAKSRAIFSRLDQDGKASPGDINEMLNPNNNFGVRPYGEKRADTQAFQRENRSSPDVLTVKLGSYTPPPTPAAVLTSIFDEDDLDTASRSTEGLPRVSSAVEEDATSNVIMGEDPDTNVNSLVTDFDLGLFGMTDAACPICFGSGFVGGYAPMGAHRLVLTFQHKRLELPPSAVVLTEQEIPLVRTHSVNWTTVLPAGCLSVDAFRMWRLDKQLTGFTVRIDGALLSKEMQLLLYCDGREHRIQIEWSREHEFSHLEVQFNQTDLEANFHIPRLNKSSNLALRERTDPFTVNLSPRIPVVKSLDLIVESTHGKVLQVKSVTGLNDKRLASLAWDAEVRPVQPQELFNMLPRRSPVARMNKPSIVRDNRTINNATSRT